MEVPSLGGLRHGDEVLPEGAVPRPAPLKLVRGPGDPLGELRIFSGAGSHRGIELLEIGERYR